MQQIRRLHGSVALRFQCWGILGWVLPKGTSETQIWMHIALSGSKVWKQNKEGRNRERKENPRECIVQFLASVYIWSSLSLASLRNYVDSTSELSWRILPLPQSSRLQTAASRSVSSSHTSCSCTESPKPQGSAS